MNKSAIKTLHTASAQDKKIKKFNAEPWQLIVSLIMRAATFYSKGFLLRNMLTMPAGAVRFCVIVGVNKKVTSGPERRGGKYLTGSTLKINENMKTVEITAIIQAGKC